jgi:CBS domain-containing protein
VAEPAGGTGTGGTVTGVRDLMNPNVVSTAGDMSVAEAASAMVAAKVGSAIVMQGAWLTGILTERDVLRAAASGEDLTASAVSKWMTPDPMSAGPDMSLDDAAQVMLLNGFRHLPVVEGKEVLGIVSIRDLLGARIRRPPKA